MLIYEWRLGIPFVTTPASPPTPVSLITPPEIEQPRLIDNPDVPRLIQRLRDYAVPQGAATVAQQDVQQNNDEQQQPRDDPDQLPPNTPQESIRTPLGEDQGEPSNQ